MIDRGFAVVNEGTSTIKDIMSFPRLCQVSLSMDGDGQGQSRVRLASVDAPEDKGALLIHKMDWGYFYHS